MELYTTKTAGFVFKNSNGRYLKLCARLRHGVEGSRFAVVATFEEATVFTRYPIGMSQADKRVINGYTSVDVIETRTVEIVDNE